MTTITRRAILTLPTVAWAQQSSPAAALNKELADVPARFESRKHRGIKGWAMPYRLFRPAASDKGRLPLIVYLHGSGGLGDDNNKQVTGGNLIPACLWAAPRIQELQAAYVVAPQTDRGWIRYEKPRTSQSERSAPVPGLGEGAAAVVDLIQSLCKELPIDDRRIYITGQSMGGGGTWHLLAHHGELFAAAVPYCGAITTETGAENPSIPVWNFHGVADTTVSVDVSRKRIEARRKAGGKPIYTEYPGVGHMCSPNACSEPDLAGWLFAQRRA